MPVECDYCGEIENMPFSCKFCGYKFCSNHRLPENHECGGLVEFKERRPKDVDKWIYEPFRAERKRARKMAKPSSLEEFKRVLARVDRRKLLYLVITAIAILTIYASI